TKSLVRTESPAPLLQPVGRTEILYRGKRLLYFGGCDYFRLSMHPEVRRAITAGMERFGLNVAASRITTGNHPLFAELEHALARFFHTEAALLTSSGYLTNLVAAEG